MEQMKHIQADIDIMEHEFAVVMDELNQVATSLFQEYPDKVEQMKHIQADIDIMEHEFAVVMDELNQVATSLL